MLMCSWFLCVNSFHPLGILLLLFNDLQQSMIGNNMLSFFSQAAIFFIALFCLVYVRIYRATSYLGGCPRLGKSGVLGYIIEALRFTLHSETVILEGKSRFPNKPFVIPTLAGPLFFLGPEYLDCLRAGPDEVFNEPLAVSEDLQLPYTMDAHQLSNPYQATVLRTDVNRSLTSYIPDILDESILATDEIFNASETQGVISFPVFDTMTHLIARVSNRVLFGLGLCRNEQYLYAVVRFAETVCIMAPFIQWSPSFLRPLVYFVLSRILGGKEAALKHMMPHLNQYMINRQTMHEKPRLVLESLIQSAPSHETVLGLAVRMLNINFGSIHTSSIFMTHVLFEIALLSPEDVESMRTEIREALESEGDWNKAALLKMRKVDSAFREVGRFYGLMYFALVRYAMVAYDLQDGTHIPPGSKVALDMNAIHFNPQIYPDPDRCDLFRFSKLREKEGTDTKYGFGTVDSNYLLFGAGRHACAGRFFAAMELKIMLSHILLHYDVTLPPGVKQRAQNFIFNGAIIPDPKAKLIFTPRPRDKL